MEGTLYHSHFQLELLSFRGPKSPIVTPKMQDFNDVYVLAYFLHPGMRGKGISSGLLPKIAETAATMWKIFENGKVRTLKLMSQLMKYKSGDAPYNLPFANDFMSPTLWWQTTEDSIGVQLKTLAVTLLSITPHSAACECTFLILGWIHSKSKNRMLISRLEAIGKLYLHYMSRIRAVMVRLPMTDWTRSKHINQLLRRRFPVEHRRF